MSISEIGRRLLDRVRPASPEDALGSSTDVPVLVVGHDALRAGAQVLLLTLLNEWRRTRPFPFRLILVRGGPLRRAYEAICPTLVLSDHTSEPGRAKAIDTFLTPRPTLVYSNTVVNGPFLDELSWLNAPVITHVHELQKAIERWAAGDIMAATLRRSSHYIACSAPVAANLIGHHSVPDASVTVIESFIDSGPEVSPRGRLGLQRGDIVVFGCGTADWRKGPDLFVDVAIRACQLDARLRFFWVGWADPAVRRSLERQIRDARLQKRIKLIGEVAQPRILFPQGHVFLLSSREDPFPLVALEAAWAGLPIVCFDETGGMPAFVGVECGVVVPNGDTPAAAAAIAHLASMESERVRLGRNGQAKVARLNHVSTAAPRIAAVLNTYL